MPAGTTLHDVLRELGALPLSAYRPVSARAFGVRDSWVDDWVLYQRIGGVDAGGETLP